MIEVRRIALGDPAAMQDWYAVMTAAEVERPIFLWPAYEVAMRVWAQPREDREEQFYLAVDTAGDGRPVAAGRVSYDLADNQHLVHLDVLVDPARRRTGVGSTLLAALEADVLARGRDTLIGHVGHPPGGSGAGAAFAAAHGYPVATVEMLKSVDLAATADRWPALAERADGRSAGYELVSWTDTTPDEHVASLCHLFTRFLAEIPLGDLDIAPQVWDAARLRANEERRRNAGIRSLLVAAVAPDGSLAGYSNLAVQPGSAYAEIDSTLVLPEHRGHALGLALKTRLHQLTVELMPEIGSIVTGNAGVNRWMNDVNTTLGYVDVEELLDVQKKLRPDPLPEEEA